MIGEPIGESSGKITGQRVIACDGGGVKVETSFQAMGKILGVEYQEVGTYWARMQSPGILYGEGQGVVMTKDGESGTWKGSGIGKPTGKGMGVTYRGVLYFQTTSSKLARLNSTCAVFEYDVDENGNAKSKMWEWK